MRTAFLLLTAIAITTGDAHAETLGMYAVAGPYTHDNLTLFVLRGPDTSSDDLQTLDEALKAKSLTIKETGSVNNLFVQNKGAKSVYMQAGEIVKGGKQDRVLEHDVIIEPKQSLAVKVYCVEAGRWRGRGHESATEFQASTKQLVGKAALAPRLEKDQSKVWESVAVKQKKLADSTGNNVESAVSPTSMQLSLENDKVVAAAEAYKKAFAKTASTYTDAIGFAYAVNGKPEAIEVLASHQLLLKQWAKLIDGVAVEAVAARGGEVTPGAVSAATFAPLVDEADAASESIENAAPNTQVKTKNARDSVLIETDNGTKAVRKTYIRK